MFEKVNPAHPDKVADRIAGAIVDLAYSKEENPKIAVEVLIGHGECNIISETSVHLTDDEINRIVSRIAGRSIFVNYLESAQDVKLAKNQEHKLRCGDNGIFKGMPVTKQQVELTNIAKKIYALKAKDGKYLMYGDRLVICQSNVNSEYLRSLYPNATVNPLGDWNGGIDVDCGATNRKLGSDMGDSITGGGLHGKDLSKADVSVNIYAWLVAQKENRPVVLSCAIGDEKIDGKPYSEIVRIASEFIADLGGFEAFAEWGLIR